MVEDCLEINGRLRLKKVAPLIDHSHALIPCRSVRREREVDMHKHRQEALSIDDQSDTSSQLRMREREATYIYYPMGISIG